MPTRKFQYPLTKTERNELIVLYAIHEQMKLRDIAGIFGIEPERVTQIIHATLERLMPDEERIYYLTAKAAVEEYAERILQSEAINRRLNEIRQKEQKLMKREFFIGETVMYANRNEIVIEVDDQKLTLSDGSRVRRASTNLQRVEDKTQFEIPFPRKRTRTNK